MLSASVDGAGILASLNTTSVTIGPSTPATVQLKILAATNAQASDYSVVVEAASNCIVHDVTVEVTVTAPDFTISASANETTISPGSWETSTVTVSAKNGFTDNVTLSVVGDPLDASLNTTTIIGGSGTATLNILVPLGTSQGNYNVSLSAQANTVFAKYSNIIVIVSGPNFALTANRSFLTIDAGGPSNSSTLTITPTGGFKDWVDLSVYSFSPGLAPILTPLSLDITQPETSNLMVSAPSSSEPGIYSVDVNATNGDLVQILQITVLVKGPDFYITPDYSIAANAGSTCTTGLTVSGIDGFAGSVSLATTSSQGMSSSLSRPSVSVPSSPSSTLSVMIPANTRPGDYSVQVNGTSTSLKLTETTSISVQVIAPDFTLESSAQQPVIALGGSRTVKVLVSSMYGFTEAISLTVTTIDSSITATIDPSASGTLNATLHITASTAAFIGATYPVNVTGTSGTIVQSLIIDILVAGPEFSLSTSQTVISADIGASQSCTISVAPVGAFAAGVTLSVFPPFNLNASLPATVPVSGSATLRVNSTIPGAYSVEIDAYSGSLFNYIDVNVNITGPDFTLVSSKPSLTITAGSSTTSTITIVPSGGLTATVSLSATPSSTGINATFGTSSNVLTVTVNATLTPGSYYIDIQGSSGPNGYLLHDIFLSVNVAGFIVNPVPSNVTVDQGATETSTIQVESINGFTGNGQITTVSPTGLTASPRTSGIVAGSFPLTLQAASDLAVGTYFVNMTGSSGSVTQNATITANVIAGTPDFAITSTPPPAVPADGTTQANTTIIVTSVYQFSGTVMLSDTVPSGLTCQPLSPPSLTGEGQSSLYCKSEVAGSFPVTITATNGTLTHSTTATFTFTTVPPPAQDFTISGTPTSLTIQEGKTGTSTITVEPTNGFADTVALTATVSPAGPSATLSTASISGGSGTSTLNVTVAGDIAAGTYTVAVQATSGNLVHTATITVTVTTAVSPTAPAPTTIFGLAPAIFYGIVALVIIVVLAGIGVLVRRSRTAS